MNHEDNIVSPDFGNYSQNTLFLKYTIKNQEEGKVDRNMTLLFLSKRKFALDYWAYL